MLSVNVTSLLLALGLPHDSHKAILSPLSNALLGKDRQDGSSASANPLGVALPSSKEMMEPEDPEMGYEEGVIGLWIRLKDARFLRERFKTQALAESPVWALLNDDIVEKVCFHA
jgi:hypothetical protein